MNIKQALKNVLEHCPNEYAKTYAQAMPESYSFYGDNGARVQVLYVLSNIVDVDSECDEVWTGLIAEETIEVLKNYKEGDWKP